jgi:2'-5' RNA ligase
MRAFVAIALPEEVKRELAELIGRLKKAGASARWSKADAIHLTLRFLGDVGEEQAQSLGNILEERLREIAPFQLEVGGTGAFPNLRRPVVAWVGVGPLEEGLGAAQALVEEAARSIGAKREKRLFSPHLTIARLRDSRNGRRLADALEQEKAFSAGCFRANECILYKSELRPTGAVHTPMRLFPFGPPKD